MKLLIDEILTHAATFDPSMDSEDTDEQREAFEDLSAFMKSCAIWHSTHFMESGYSVSIEAQKCTMSEEKVNEFFYDVLSLFKGVQISYAALGGAGCDFALHITQAK